MPHTHYTEETLGQQRQNLESLADYKGRNESSLVQTSLCFWYVQNPYSHNLKRSLINAFCQETSWDNVLVFIFHTYIIWNSLFTLCYYCLYCTQHTYSSFNLERKFLGVEKMLARRNVFVPTSKHLIPKSELSYYVSKISSSVWYYLLENRPIVRAGIPAFLSYPGLIILGEQNQQWPDGRGRRKYFIGY